MQPHKLLSHLLHGWPVAAWSWSGWTWQHSVEHCCILRNLLHWWQWCIWSWEGGQDTQVRTTSSVPSRAAFRDESIALDTTNWAEVGWPARLAVAGQFLSQSPVVIAALALTCCKLIFGLLSESCHSGMLRGSTSGFLSVAIAVEEQIRPHSRWLSDPPPLSRTYLWYALIFWSLRSTDTSSNISSRKV